MNYVQRLLCGLLLALPGARSVAAAPPSPTITTRPQVQAGAAVFTVNSASLPTLSISGVTVNEGASGTVHAIFTVTLSQMSLQSVLVYFSTSDNTAMAGSDYVAASGFIGFYPGLATNIIDVSVIGDSIHEPDESFFVTLYNPIRATITQGQGIGTIVNDDAASGNTPPTISDIPDQFAILGRVEDPPQANLLIPFTVNDAETDPTNLTVTAISSNFDLIAIPCCHGFAGIGTLGGTGSNRTLNIILSRDAGPGSTTITVTVSDGQFTTSDSFIVTVDPPGPPHTPLMITIIPDVTIPLGTPSASTDFSVTGGTGAPTLPTITVDSSNPNLIPNGNIQVGPGMINGPPFQTALTPLSGQTGSSTITVIVSDGTVSANTSFLFSVVPQPVLSIGDVTRFEGDSGTALMTFTITLSAPAPQFVIVHYSTQDGTASSFSDYIPVTDSLVAFSPGQTSKTIDIQVSGDTVNEPDEIFFVTLSQPQGAIFSQSVAAGRILNDDAVPVLSISNVTITEGNSGTINAVFTVQRPNNPVFLVLDYATSDGTAVRGSDYVPTIGTLAFAPGQTSKTITVPVIGDKLVEPDETFFVNLGTASIPNLLQATGTIVNDDNSVVNMPLLSINDVSVMEGNSGFTTAVFTVNLSAVGTQPITVNWTTTDGTATASSDYVATSGILTFAPGQLSLTIPVQVLGDTLVEPDETFFVNLSNPVNATISASQGVGTIRNDDASINTSPTISQIPDQNVAVGTPNVSIPFTVGDAETPVAALTLIGSSSNPALLPDANIAFSGNDANRTVILTPAIGQTGSATITLTVSDGSASASDSFVFTVTVQAPPNNTLTISPISDQTIAVNSTTAPIPFTITNANANGGNLMFSASSSNPTLVPNENIQFGGSGANRAVVIIPAPDQTGDAIVTISAFDGAAAASVSFALRVKKANTPPTISSIPNWRMDLCQPTGEIAFTISDLETPAKLLRLKATSSNRSLVLDQNIAFSGSGSNRTISISPSVFQSGLTVITVEVADNDGGSASAQFALIVGGSLGPIVENDINGDGAADILFQNSDGSVGAWFMNRGPEMYSASFFNPSNVGDLGWQIVGSGRLDLSQSCGSPDLLFQHKDGTLAMWHIYRMELTSSALLNPSQPGPGWTVVATGDVNRDGRKDILFQHTDGTLAVWYMDGINLIEGKLLNPSNPGDPRWRVVGTADLRQIGSTDLIFQHTDGTLAAWYMDGINLVQGVLLNPSTPGSDWRVAGTVDLNQDGKTDLLFQHTDGSVGVWFMNGIDLISAQMLNPSHPGDGWRIVGPR